MLFAITREARRTNDGTHAGDRGDREGGARGRVGLIARGIGARRQPGPGARATGAPAGNGGGRVRLRPAGDLPRRPRRGRSLSCRVRPSDEAADTTAARCSTRLSRAAFGTSSPSRPWASSGWRTTPSGGSNGTWRRRGRGGPTFVPTSSCRSLQCRRSSSSCTTPGPCVPAADARLSFVDVRDIAAVAVMALCDVRHSGMAYTLTGGEAIDHAAVACDSRVRRAGTSATWPSARTRRAT